ncbi:C40 family peptidase [Pseudomonas pseudonitroreducens]|uniref:C40 family peptidase n=1 Tax=Pseudomonas pseudonitroreducens TaxID=2892326 RepID=UPI001F41FE53|nr:NlpC/P60 family protein [Pseudomonas pseudonitroreducens]
MTRDEIVSASMEAEGTPFRHQGRVVGLGLDCAGLYVFVCQRLGIPHQDAHGYPRTPFDGELERQMDAQPSLQRIAVSEAQKGDVLLMRMTKQPQHIAIHAGEYRGHPYVIHASEQHGKVCVHRLDSTWFGRVVRAYKFEGV